MPAGIIVATSHPIIPRASALGKIIAQFSAAPVQDDRTVLQSAIPTSPAGATQIFLAVSHTILNLDELLRCLFSNRLRINFRREIQH